MGLVLCLGYGETTVSELGKSLNNECSNWGNFSSTTEMGWLDKTIASLLNPDYWTTYKDQVRHAVWAIGSPTLKMFVNSYNEINEMNGCSTRILLNVSEDATKYELDYIWEDEENKNLLTETTSDLHFGGGGDSRNILKRGLLQVSGGFRAMLASPCDKYTVLNSRKFR